MVRRDFNVDKFTKDSNIPLGILSNFKHSDGTRVLFEINTLYRPWFKFQKLLEELKKQNDFNKDTIPQLKDKKLFTFTQQSSLDDNIDEL